MPSSTTAISPNLTTFTRSLKSRGTPVESSVENLIWLFKRRQIRGSEPCAIATAILLRRVVENFKLTDVSKLIQRVRQVGRRLISAQPRELAIGNIVRRILGVIREETDEDRERVPIGQDYADRPQRLERDNDIQPASPSSPSGGFGPLQDDNGELSPEAEGYGASRRPPPLHSHTSNTSMTTAPRALSMFSLLSLPESNSALPIAISGVQQPEQQPPSSDPGSGSLGAAKELKAEVIEGIQEILDELNQANDQIAAYALEQIHSNEIILTHTSSVTVQRFFLKAAAKRKFTVIHAEAYPNNHQATHTAVVGKIQTGSEDSLSPEMLQKTLATAGITVILIPDSAVFALMSRVNKVILGPEIVFANGGLVAAAGAKAIALAASSHRVPVLVLAGVYKLSPTYPFDLDLFMEDGDPSKVVGYEDGEFVDKIEVENPLFDFVPADLVNLYITNLGGHAPSYLYRSIADHYRAEDIDLDKFEA